MSGNSLPYETVGAGGRPVVFLHGGGFGGAMWRPVAETLTGRRCLLLDLPGHGAARAIPFGSFDRVACRVAQTIEGACRGKADIVGLSLGGYVGLSLLLRRPAVVGRAVLSGFSIAPFPNPWRNRIVARALSPVATTGWFRRRAARAMNADAFLNEAAIPKISRKALIQVMESALAFDPGAQALAGIETPTLALAGGREHGAICESVAQLARLSPACAARIAPNLGHGWSGEDPQLFAATVAAWLDNAPLPQTLLDPTQ
ncbi:MAG: alpha/beta hydrolase [Pseudomonadota bacterium]